MSLTRNLPPAHSFEPCQVTLIPGDGIGAELADSVKEVFEHVNAPIEWDQCDVSGMSSTGAGTELFNQAMDSLKRNRVGLKGACVLNPHPPPILLTSR